MSDRNLVQEVIEDWSDEIRETEYNWVGGITKAHAQAVIDRLTKLEEDWAAEFEKRGTETAALHRELAELKNGRLAKLEEGAEVLDGWRRAYPLDIFPEVEDWDEVRKALEGIGVTLDRVSASNMRHVVTKLAEAFGMEELKGIRNE